MRQLTEHQINECNRAISIGAGKPNERGNVTLYEVQYASDELITIRFQDGPVADGVNGITNEVLLAILADRLRAAQTGPFSCRENALALTKVEEAQHWLLHRTRAREARGVEGTHTP